jgi:hypothetical protein
MMMLQQPAAARRRAGTPAIDRWWLTDPARKATALWPLSTTRNGDNVIANEFHMVPQNGAQITANGLECVSESKRHASAGDVLNKGRLAMSIGCWVYIPNGSPRATSIIGKTELVNNVSRYSIGEAATSLSPRVTIGNSSFESNVDRVVDGWAFLTGVWTGDSGSAIIYRDGVERARGTFSALNRLSTFPYTLGSIGISDVMDGNIDDAFHFFRALTVDEINEIMAAGRGNLYA